MKCTVLGASGFIGTRLVRRLLGSGFDCFTPAREDRRLFDQPLGTVFYCIGLTSDYLADHYATVEAHVGQLARILRDSSFERLVYLSSTRLYDSSSSPTALESDDLMVNPAFPRHLYDLSKALGENLCLNSSGGRGSVARLSCVYDREPGSPGFMSELIDRLRRDRDIRLDSSSGTVRDYIALDDVVEALIAISIQPDTGIFNVASGENVSNGEIADFLNQAGCNVSLSRTTDRQTVPGCDVSKLRALGLAPRVVRAYLADCLNPKSSHATAQQPFSR
jgi:nucleoside-diphosphate-sugar epimerase